MPRIRTIKPEHWNDRELSKISLQAHLLWIGTWNFSDDKGIFDGDPILIKSQLFPRRTDVRIEQVEQWLGQLVEARFIIPFTHSDGQGYYINRTFETHQRIDKPQPSKFDNEVIKKLISDHSKNIPRKVLPVKESIVQVEESILGAIAPVDPEPAKNDFKKEYKKIQDECVGLPKVEIWTKLKSFITDHKPKFCEPYVDIWNLFATSYDVSIVKAVSDSRKKKFNVRLKEEEFDFLAILEKIKKSKHLRGDNGGSWKVNFDWIFENDKNYLKILEGNYD